MLDKSMHNEVVRMYLSGEPNLVIAKKFGRKGCSFVTYHVGLEGLSYCDKKIKPKPIPDRVIQMIELKKDGKSFSEVGRIFGITKQAVHRQINYYRIKSQKYQLTTGNGNANGWVFAGLEAR